MKKVILRIGAIVSIVSPTILFVSCGSSSNKKTPPTNITQIDLLTPYFSESINNNRVILKITNLNQKNVDATVFLIQKGSNIWKPILDINNYNLQKGDKVKVSFETVDAYHILNPKLKHEFIYTITSDPITKIVLLVPSFSESINNNQINLKITNLNQPNVQASIYLLKNGSWTEIQNLNNQNFQKGDQVKVSFKVSSANYTLNPNSQHEFLYTITSNSVTQINLLPPSFYESIEKGRVKLTITNLDQSHVQTLIFLTRSGSNTPKNLKSIKDLPSDLTKGDKIWISLKPKENFIFPSNTKEDFYHTITSLPSSYNSRIITNNNRFDLKNIHTKELNFTFKKSNISRKMIMGWIGENKDHPEDGDFRVSSFFYKDKNYGFLNETEIKEFIKYFFENINHGPEINNFGSLTLDNPNMDTGVSGFFTIDTDDNDHHTNFSPTHSKKGYIWCNTNDQLENYRIDENEFHNLKTKKKFDILSQTLQHEYNHYVQYSYVNLKNINKKSENIQYKSFDPVSDPRLNYLPSRLYNDLRRMFGLSVKPLDLSEVDFNISTAIENYNNNPSDHNKKILREIYFSQMLNVNNTLEKIKITNNHQKTSNQHGKEIYLKDLKRYDNFILMANAYDNKQDNQEHWSITKMANRYLLNFEETLARLIQISTGYGSPNLMRANESFDFLKFAIFDLNMFQEFKRGAFKTDNILSMDQRILIQATQNDFLLNLRKNNGNNILAERQDGFKERFKKWYVENLMGYNNDISYMSLNKQGRLSIGGYLPKGKNYKLLVSLDDIFNDSDTKIKLSVGQTVQRFKNKYIGSVFDRPQGIYDKKYWYAKNVDENIKHDNRKFYLSFWDDVNHDGYVDSNEIVPINSINGFYSNGNEMTASFVGPLDQLGINYTTAIVKNGNEMKVTTKLLNKK